MNKIEVGYQFRPEYDLKNVQLVKTSTKHRSYGDLIRLEPDVASAFPDSDAVHAALRYLIELGQRQTLLS
jgi:hypothetical protein